MKERVCICLQIFTHHHWQKLEPELSSRNWSRGQRGTWLSGLFSMACLVHFIVASRTTWQGVPLPTMRQTLPYLSLIKTTDQCGGHFLTFKYLFQNDSILFQTGKTQPAQWLHGKEHLLPNLATRVLSLEPTLWKERNHSCKLPSVFTGMPTYTWPMLMHMHAHNECKKSIICNIPNFTVHGYNCCLLREIYFPTQ